MRNIRTGEEKFNIIMESLNSNETIAEICSCNHRFGIPHFIRNKIPHLIMASVVEFDWERGVEND